MKIASLQSTNLAINKNGQYYPILINVNAPYTNGVGETTYDSKGVIVIVTEIISIEEHEVRKYHVRTSDGHVKIFNGSQFMVEYEQ